MFPSNFSFVSKGSGLGTSLVVQWLGTLLLSLVEELRSHKLQGQKKKMKSREKWFGLLGSYRYPLEAVMSLPFSSLASFLFCFLLSIRKYCCPNK